MSKVSALVSAYFAQDYLSGRLINLYGRKNTDLQIIVVAQKGSTEEAIAGDYDLTLVTTPDIPSIGKAWNLGIQHAVGDYLTTANTDDRYNIGGLSAMVDVLDQHPEVGLVFSQVDLDDGERVYPWKRIENETGRVKNIHSILKQRCIIGPLPLWRRSIHDQVGLFHEGYTVACDYDMWTRMARVGVGFYYIAESCGIYVRRDDSLEHRNKSLSKLESLEIQEAMR